MRSDYSNLLGHSGGSGYASRSTGYQYGTILQPKCKCSTACHQTRIPHPALKKIDSAAWLHDPFQPLLLQMETSEWWKKGTMITETHPDVMRTVEFLPDQVIGISIRNSHQTINLAHDNPQAEAGKIIIMMTTIDKTRKRNNSPIPSYQQEQRMKTGCRPC